MRKWVKTAGLEGFVIGLTAELIYVSLEAGLVGSPHDFSPTGPRSNSIPNFAWKNNTRTSPCEVCHVVHAGGPGAAERLGNQGVTKGTTRQYTGYGQTGSATFNRLGFGSVKLGSSAVCLSCHDGSVARNLPYGSRKLQATSRIGLKVALSEGTSAPSGANTTLMFMHPIGVSYAAAQAAAPGQFKRLPAELAWMLKGPEGTVECASCHDIHRISGTSASVSNDLVVDNRAGGLCLTCHNK